MRAVGRLGGAERWMPHTLGHSETPEERAVPRTLTQTDYIWGGSGLNMLKYEAGYVHWKFLCIFPYFAFWPLPLLSPAA